jgi:hypothetical protein
MGLRRCSTMMMKNAKGFDRTKPLATATLALIPAESASPHCLSYGVASTVTVSI